MEGRVARIKRQLQQIGEMRPGSLNQQRTVCGREGCRCQAPRSPQKHGPYFQLSYVHQGRSTTQFIPRDLVPPVVQQLDNYKRFKALTTEWVALALALAKDTLAAEKVRLKSGTPPKRPGRTGSKN
jgi:hypothetical protein